MLQSRMWRINQEACRDATHVLCDKTGELCYSPCFPEWGESKGRIHFSNSTCLICSCLFYIPVVAFIFMMLKALHKGDLNRNLLVYHWSAAACRIESRRCLKAHRCSTQLFGAERYSIQLKWQEEFWYSRMCPCHNLARTPRKGQWVFCNRHVLGSESVQI